MSKIYQVVTKVGSVIAAYKNEEEAKLAESFYNQGDKYDRVETIMVDNPYWRKPTPEEAVVFEHDQKMKSNLKLGYPWWNLN
jgi:hypothetical protein